VNRIRNKLLHGLRIIASIFAGLVIFFPVYWVVLAALKPIDRLYRGHALWPGKDLMLTNFISVVQNQKFWGFIGNSVIVSAVSVAIVIILSALGAYSLARLRFWKSDFIANTVLFVYMVPKVLLAIPIYMWMYRLGLLNTRIGVIGAHVAIGLPFALWMLRGFFKTLPDSLEDAALIDGCSWIGVLVRIILPLSGSGIVAVAMYTLILSWNDYLLAFMLISKSSLATLPVGLVTLFEASDAREWGAIMAGSVLSTLPVVLMFVILQSFLVKGLTAGAQKG
jgi:ABC-type glycerol-3-phosphate transport system permease component